MDGVPIESDPAAQGSRSQDQVARSGTEPQASVSPPRDVIRHLYRGDIDFPYLENRLSDARYFRHVIRLPHSTQTGRRLGR